MPLPIDMTVTQGDHVHHCKHGDGWVAIITRKTEAGPFSVAVKAHTPEFAEQLATRKMSAELPAFRVQAAEKHLHTATRLAAHKIYARLQAGDPSAKVLVQKNGAYAKAGHPPAVALMKALADTHAQARAATTGLRIGERVAPVHASTRARVHETLIPAISLTPARVSTLIQMARAAVDGHLAAAVAIPSSRYPNTPNTLQYLFRNVSVKKA